MKKLRPDCFPARMVFVALVVPVGAFPGGLRLLCDAFWQVPGRSPHQGSPAMTPELATFLERAAWEAVKRYRSR